MSEAFAPVSGEIDAEGLLRCLRREGEPSRVYPMELFLDGEVKAESCRRAVQAFRRSRNDAASQVVLLHGLDPRARYEITSLDGAPTQTRTGEELLNQGLTVEIADRPGSAIHLYQKCTA